MQQVFIVAAKRTALGSFGGVLRYAPAIKLATHVVKSALKESQINGEQVEEVIMGNVLSAGLGQAPSRQVALKSDISPKSNCTTINKVCGSGLKAVIQGIQAIQLGVSNVVLAGGMESMSNCPYYLDKHRFGARVGNSKVIDGVIHDGLMDATNNVVTGQIAEYCATKFNITREEMDDYAVESYNRALQALKNKWFNEIVPIRVTQGIRKPSRIIDEDEQITKNGDPEKLRLLRSVFVKDGAITAGNSSALCDGAAALVLVSEKKLKDLKLTPIARVLAYAETALEPMLFVTSPIDSLKLACKRANLMVDQIECHEINESFALVPILFERSLGISHSIVNIFGGGVALGHPLGCSGARLVTTLLSVLKVKKTKIGAASIGNGGGGACTLIIERI
ncbi:acetyl-coa acetyltransferase cytosolic [Anaeramoeba ignava]|uniref:Acetyl-coa acetyltransferase cytosolic n=1 Tax=Anaeramoeba ignava TaxID=1746090 RepID=A0A9Q0LT82_ANAIG|nr:acetyl-coa acetyltransferase cytosolic [Anaeramoeba ignava]|eukprot:Anaeramoba_ignava/a608683_47.p1 GENE.a608683_47~~a608683_47.p1  ORF type:complete len:394 (+),score=73.73 a608683_47:91-1272(+)